MVLRGPLAALAVILSWAASASLPATPYSAKIDGDPREAYLLGARSLPMSDAVTGYRDGSVRAFALATPEGLYVAVLSTEPDRGDGLVRVGPRQILQGDWMGVKIGGPRKAVFVLGPSGGMASFGEAGGSSGISDFAWIAVGSIFGRTWAGEWLLPWETLGLKGGSRFSVEALRGRKMRVGSQALEVLSASGRGPTASRWGGAGTWAVVPEQFPIRRQEPWALAPYEVRPALPSAARRAACSDAVPAGEVATAWLDLPASDGPVGVHASCPLAEAEVFEVDFWWQAGTREEQDALFPVRVAVGMGDVLVAERLVPMPPGGFPASPWPRRVYLRCTVSRDRVAGLAISSIRVTAGSHAVEVPWVVRVAKPLPLTGFLSGLYYPEQDPTRWPADFADMAAHGFNAVTCYAKGEEAWARFREEARKAGLDGSFTMGPTSLNPPPGSWVYTVDEPTGDQALGEAKDKAAAARPMGFKAWTALCWPDSLVLAKELDGYALSQNLLPLAGPEGLAEGRWTYFQGLREDPSYNRLMAGVTSRAFGLKGFWVYCYAYPDGPLGDWEGPYLRHDACVENGPGGERVQTVHWEALREGILDARLAQSVGPGADRAFPALGPVLRGEYWKLDRRIWSFSFYRTALIGMWEKKKGG